jgi:hypothetical protein
MKDNFQIYPVQIENVADPNPVGSGQSKYWIQIPIRNRPFCKECRTNILIGQ